MQLAWLHDPEIAAAEIRKNADRGFKAVAFPEAPHQAGLPSLHSGYWDPFIRACVETDTVICVHTGSSGSLPDSSAPDAPLDSRSAMFGAGYSLGTAVDWLYSFLPVRFPDLKVVITEGGIGWVPALLDRLDHNDRRGDYRGTWKGSELRASELLKRNFWFCLLDEPSAMAQIDRIGLDNVLYETDFPHGDTSWPDTQALVETHLKGQSAEVVRQITWENASKLFRHPVPKTIQDDPNAF